MYSCFFVLSWTCEFYDLIGNNVWVPLLVLLSDIHYLINQVFLMPNKEENPVAVPNALRGNSNDLETRSNHADYSGN